MRQTKGKVEMNSDIKEHDEHATPHGLSSAESAVHERLVMSRFTQGICEDGATILRNGELMTVEEILYRLNESENIKKLYEFELTERMNIFAAISSMTNGEWDKLYKIRPDLHKFVKQAVSRECS